MTVEFEVGGRRHSLGVRRDGAAWVVSAGEREYRASVAEVGGRWSLLIGTRSYEVTFDEGAVHVDGTAVPLAIIDRRTAFSRRGHDAAGEAGPRSVTAPMPGRIVKVLVAPGDIVTARQGVVVIEAMKMENELRAPKAGTVREVRVSEGASVDAHAVLLIVD